MDHCAEGHEMVFRTLKKDNKDNCCEMWCFSLLLTTHDY